MEKDFVFERIGKLKMAITDAAHLTDDEKNSFIDDLDELQETLAYKL